MYPMPLKMLSISGIVYMMLKTINRKNKKGGGVSSIISTALKSWSEFKMNAIRPKPLTILLLTLGIVGLVGIYSVSAQVPPADIYPGDPVSEDDKIFVSLDTSRDSTCGITAANNIRCWGANLFAPMWAGGYIDVAVGTSHTCGIDLDGFVQCWGRNSLSSNMLTPPTDNGVPIKFKSIDSYVHHTCGIRADNDLLECWGWDRDGQVTGTHARGQSTNLYTSPLPFYRAYDYSNDAFAQISPGNVHTCGIINLAPGETGTNARCWGYNNTTEYRSVVPQIYLSTTFKQITTTDRFNCALIDGGEDDGKVICWGDES